MFETILKTQNNVDFLLKKSKTHPKTWSLAWKIKNRPTCCDFDFFFLPPNFTKFLNLQENVSALLYLYSNLS